MPFPAGWPPRPSTGSLNLKVLIEGTATTSYEDNAYLFYDVAGANPFTPTPYVRPGTDEKTPTPIVSSRPGTPLGGGRDHRDAVPFNPNVFKRGAGEGSAQTAFSQSGTTTTYTDYTEKFDRGMINKEIRISGSTSPGNDGTFTITDVPDQHTLVWENATGASENFPVTGEFRIRMINEAPPKPAIWSNTIRVMNFSGSPLYISFDGETDQGLVPANSSHVYRNRAEAGISLRVDAGTADFAVEAW